MSLHKYRKIQSYRSYRIWMVKDCYRSSGDKYSNQLSSQSRVYKHKLTRHEFWRIWGTGMFPNCLDWLLVYDNCQPK